MRNMRLDISISSSSLICMLIDSEIARLDTEQVLGYNELPSFSHRFCPKPASLHKFHLFEVARTKATSVECWPNEPFDTDIKPDEPTHDSWSLSLVSHLQSRNCSQPTHRMYNTPLLSR